MLVLYRNDGVPDTLLANLCDQYFPLNHFELLVMDEDPCEDSDALVRNAAGVMSRRMPNKDYTFEEGKCKIRKCIEWQQEALRRMKLAHHTKCPNANIVDSDNENYCYV